MIGAVFEKDFEYLLCSGFWISFSLYKSARFISSGDGSRPPLKVLEGSLLELGECSYCAYDLLSF